VADERTERRLAAILAADVVGYSRLMGADEVGTLAALKAHRREVIEPAIAGHRGRIVKTTGDGLLVEFASAVDAVTCAMAVQTQMDEREGDGGSKITFRIGINVGDIIVDREDIFGDGVNVAARVENECEPGGVYLSGNAFEQVRGKTVFAFDDLGERSLKNIDRPVRLYAVRPAGSAPQASLARAWSAEFLPSLDKPSIAVLPFQNMSGDSEQEYFADGIVEDIITALSHFKSLFVIARNSSFAYKGKAIDIKQIGRELGVRYVLEGSVRKAGGRLRITGQLIEAATGAHLWADKFDGEIGDVFDLQDRVTSRVAGVIAPKIEQNEIQRASRKPTGNLEAYDYYLRALASINQSTKAANENALRMLRKAVELDPQFAVAIAWIGGCYNQRKSQGWIVDPENDSLEAVRAARRALEVGRDDSTVLAASAFTQAFFAGEITLAMSLIDRATQLNPNQAFAWALSGWIRIYQGDPDAAIEHFFRALKLSPLDSNSLLSLAGMAFAHFFAQRDEEAQRWADQGVAESPNNLVTLRILTAALASGGQMERARASAARLMALNPDEKISTVPIMSLLQKSRDRERLQEFLGLAGIPK